MFSDRLREFRTGKGLSQDALAKAVGISNGTIGMYETGKRQPTADNAMKLAKYFGVQVEVLLDGTTSPELADTSDDAAWDCIREMAKAEGMKPEEVVKAILSYKLSKERSE